MEVIMNNFKRALFFLLFACAGASNLLTMLPDDLRLIADTMQFGDDLEQQISQLINFLELNILPEEQKRVLEGVIGSIKRGAGASYATQLRGLADFIEQEQQNVISASAGNKRNRNFSDEERESKLKKQTSGDDIVQITQAAQTSPLRCCMCYTEYTQAMATVDEIACCKNYHLFCVDCVAPWENKLGFEFKPNNRCPSVGCIEKLFDDQDETISLKFSNSPDESNYESLQGLLASCRDIDVQKKQVLKLLLKRGQVERKIASDLVLPSGDTDSDVSDESDDEALEKEADRIVCAICNGEIEDRPMMLSCVCKNVYHELCATELIVDPKKCPQCYIFVEIVEKQQ